MPETARDAVLRELADESTSLPRLSLVAEKAGCDFNGDPDVEAALCKLLRSHSVSYVREGALYGLAPMWTPNAWRACCIAARRDPNDIMRRIAGDVVEDYGDEFAVGMGDAL